MPLSDHDPTDDICSGVVAATYEDVSQVQDEIETFLQDNLASCLRYMPGFEDGSIRTLGESGLCESLCRWINSFAIGKTLFRFFIEFADSGNKARAPDFTVFPEVVPTAVLRVGSHDYNCETKLYIIEAKRLPVLNETGSTDRTREYVVSDWEQRNSSGKPLKGGIERFKELAHGRHFDRAGMIAFLQAETPDYWLAAINSWINELISHAIPRHRAGWAQEDLLCSLAEQPAIARLSQYKSRHIRVPDFTPIGLRHFWLVLT